MERATTSVAIKTISQICVLDTRLSPGIARVLLAVSSDELPDEVFGVDEISAVTLDDSQLVTLKLEFGNYLQFQHDTGAQCNVVPVQEGDQRF